MPTGALRTAGERVAVRAGERWFRLLQQATGTGLDEEYGTPSVVLEVSADRAAFGTGGLRRISRDAFGDGGRSVLLNAGGSGFDLQAQVSGEVLYLQARYRPAAPVRAANVLLGPRFGLLAGQVLLHYPALWRAAWRGRVPLHAAVVGLPEAGAVLLLAGPSGVGKSTLVAGLAAAGAPVAADNLCVTDGIDCHGVLEPFRLAGGRGRRTSHGRAEQPVPGRVPMLRPTVLAVAERGPRAQRTPVEPADAARALVAGTYAAGELRRYWQFAATLALATGVGPAHPPVAAVAGALAGRLPGHRLRAAEGEPLAVPFGNPELRQAELSRIGEQP
ncbi:MAG TPA: hypothetical protein VMB79_13310 [Jatrophihabitans sp.]|nr:hypothetical protein [Jatrophihabitans sp.]